MKILLVPFLLAVSLPAFAEVDPKIHQLCIEAKDYEGCSKRWYNKNMNAASSYFNSDDDKGGLIKTFEALSEGKDCKVVFYENALSVCGEDIGREAIKSWDQRNLQGCNAIKTWCVGEIHFDIIYFSKDGISGSKFTFLNRNAARDLTATMTSWSNIIQGEKQ